MLPENHTHFSHFPELSAWATCCALLAAILQFVLPGMNEALGRLPNGVIDPGELWRLATPLLVQTLGHFQVVVNLISLALIGAVAEQLLTRRQWGGAFLAGSLCGQIAAYFWHESGGGDSIAVCGLAGASAAALITARSSVPVLGLATVGYVALLTGWELSGYSGVLLFGGLLGLASFLLRRVSSAVSLSATIIGVLLCTALLCVEEDLHGVSLASGMGLFALITIARQRRTRSQVAA